MKAIGKFGLALMLSAMLAGNVWAERRHHHPHYAYPRASVHFGVVIGAPWLFPPYPRYYSQPYYWPAVRVPVPVAPVIVAPPVVYVEQTPPLRTSVPVLESGYWYYCEEAGAYYPQVRSCTGDWRKVAPRPAE
jgi:hypothetical protein